MDMSTIKNILSATVLLGGACLVYANKDKLFRRFISHKPEEDKSSQEKGGTGVLKEVCQSFIMYSDVFQGLYEPMFKASLGRLSFERMRNVLTEWDIRVKSIGNAPVSLCEWWATVVADIDVLPNKEMQARAVMTMQMIDNCGIVRDNKTDFVADDETCRYYQHVDGLIFETGQKLRVESPCWFMPTQPVRIIEKGYCEIL